MVSAHHLIEESQPLLCDAIMRHTHSDMHKVQGKSEGKKKEEIPPSYKSEREIS